MSCWITLQSQSTCPAGKIYIKLDKSVCCDKNESLHVLQARKTFKLTLSVTNKLNHRCSAEQVEIKSLLAL